MLEAGGPGDQSAACTVLDMFGPLKPGEDAKRSGTVELSYGVDPADDAK